MTIDCKNYKEINQDLVRTKKLLVSLGCSFTAGTSAWDINLVEEYPPIHEGWLGYHAYDRATKQEIAKKYQHAYYFEDSGALDLHEMERNNSFVNQLASKYYNDSWTPVNLGGNGNGNIAAATRLYLYPINYDKAEEIVVIFCPTGMQRIDFMKDNTTLTPYYLGDDFQTLWPHLGTPKTKEDQHWRYFHDGYGMCIHSEKFEILNTIMAFRMISEWCRFHKAKLIVLPAFDRCYTKEYFREHLGTKVSRDSQTHEILGTSKISMQHEFEMVESQLNSVPWDSFFKPLGQPTFHDLALSQEPELDHKMTMYEVATNRKNTPNNWILACGHPSAKAHSLLAQELYNFLESNK